MDVKSRIHSLGSNFTEHDALHTQNQQTGNAEISLESIFLKDNIGSENLFLSSNFLNQRNDTTLSFGKASLTKSSHEESDKKNLKLKYSKDEQCENKEPNVMSTGKSNSGGVMTVTSTENTASENESSKTNNNPKGANEKEVIKYYCEYCNKSFTRPSSLTIHIYTHTGEKPHECTFPGCMKRFSVLSNLRRHLKLHKNQQALVYGAYGYGNRFGYNTYAPFLRYENRLNANSLPIMAGGSKSQGSLILPREYPISQIYSNPAFYDPREFMYGNSSFMNTQDLYGYNNRADGESEALKRALENDITRQLQKGKMEKRHKKHENKLKDKEKDPHDTKMPGYVNSNSSLSNIAVNNDTNKISHASPTLKRGLGIENEFFPMSKKLNAEPTKVGILYDNTDDMVSSVLFNKAFGAQNRSTDTIFNTGNLEKSNKPIQFDQLMQFNERQLFTNQETQNKFYNMMSINGLQAVENNSNSNSNRNSNNGDISITGFNTNTTHPTNPTEASMITQLPDFERNSVSNTKVDANATATLLGSVDSTPSVFMTGDNRNSQSNGLVNSGSTTLKSSDLTMLSGTKLTQNHSMQDDVLNALQAQTDSALYGFESRPGVNKFQLDQLFLGVRNTCGSFGTEPFKQSLSQPGIVNNTNSNGLGDSINDSISALLGGGANNSACDGKKFPAGNDISHDSNIQQPSGYSLGSTQSSMLKSQATGLNSEESTCLINDNVYEFVQNILNG